MRYYTPRALDNRRRVTSGEAFDIAAVVLCIIAAVWLAVSP